MKRRDFLGLGVGLGAMAVLPWPAMAAASKRMLIAVHMMGGNDGLNTVVPWDSPLYRAARPALALSRSQLHALRPGLGLHAALEPLLPLWEKGQMAIVNGVGYPSPSHSHFRSTEIWQTASCEEARDEGWLGCWLDGSTHRVGVNADTMLAQALWSAQSQPLCVRARDQFHLPPNGHAYLQALDGLYGGASSQHLRRTYRSMRRSMRSLENSVSVELGDRKDDFSKNLSAMLAFMPAGNVYHTSVGGFDTHSGQKERHAKALASMAGGVSALWQALRRRHWDGETLIMVYSEFGRRVAENASGGTDHGTAGAVFLIGKQVRGGLHGEVPSLSDTEEGDLRHHVDFRSIYAAILERWLETDPRPILGRTFPALAVLR